MVLQRSKVLGRDACVGYDAVYLLRSGDLQHSDSTNLGAVDQHIDGLTPSHGLLENVHDQPLRGCEPAVRGQTKAGDERDVEIQVLEKLRCPGSTERAQAEVELPRCT